MTTTTEALEAADALLKKQHAYDKFEEILSFDDDDLQTTLALYLADATKNRRDTLLACMADRETEIGYPELIESIRRLLIHPDTIMRRMAALALFSAGPLGEEALSEEMGGKLPKDVALDFVELFRIASGVSGL